MEIREGVHGGERTPSEPATLAPRSQRSAAIPPTVLLGIAVLVAVLLATNEWGGGLSPDARTYESIAIAAPGLPDHEIGSAFTERFAVPWVAGTLGEVLPGGARTGLWVVVAVSIGISLLLLASICAHLNLSTTATLLCVGLMMFNVHGLRTSSHEPAPVDPFLVLGVAVVMWSLVTERVPRLLLGSLLAILGRQTALLAVPAATLWVYAGQGWRSRAMRERLWLAGVMVAIVLVAYGVVKLASSSFTYPFAPSIPGDTILPVLGNPGSIRDVLAQAVRVAAPPLPTVGCIIGVLVGVAWAGRRIRLPVEFWCALLIAVSIVIQPLLISPHFEGFVGNQARLSSLGVFPLCVALAYALRAAGERLEGVSQWVVVAGAAALLASSLREGGTVIGPEGNLALATIQVLATTLLAILLAVTLRRSAAAVT